MNAIRIAPKVYWVGAIDWDLRNFHGYLTQRGSTYNAYLILDDKITLVDTVKSHLSDEMMQRIRSVVDPSRIDYIICNHVEMDHSGAIPDILRLAPQTEVFVSPKGEAGIRAHFHQDWKFRQVATGDELTIGEYTLDFISTPMVHWPDNMMTYVRETKLLFSNDAFGQHLASSSRIDDDYPLDIIKEEARKYYANIVLPYSKQVAKVLDLVCEFDIEMIAPSHGIIWKDHIDEIIAEYRYWSSNTTIKKAIIVYDSMWGSTEKIAHAIYQGFEECGYNSPMVNLQHTHISDIMTEIINAEYVCVGSPTLNGNVLPTVASFLTYLNGLAPKGRKAIVFGSYGWSRRNIAQIEKYMENFTIMATYDVNYRPDENALNSITEDLKNILTGSEESE